MKLELSHEELTALVEDKVSDLGFSGDLTIEFQARRGGQIDTVIEIGSKKQGTLLPTKDASDIDEITENADEQPAPTKY